MFCKAALDQVVMAHVARAWKARKHDKTCDDTPGCSQVALVLSGANLYGYIRCSRAAKAKVGTFAESVATGIFKQGLAQATGFGQAASSAAPHGNNNNV